MQSSISQTAIPDGSIVRVPSDDEAIYASLLEAIETRSIRLGELEEDIAPLLRALERFEYTYNSQLAALQRELRELRAKTESVDHRTARIHARMVADPNHIMGDLFDEDELREIGDLFGVDLPESWFQSARDSEDRRRQEFTGDETDEEWDGTGGEDAFHRFAQRVAKPRLPGESERELRTLHRALARRFHPDLATTEAERIVCQEMMLRINDAWHSQDLAELRTIDAESDYLDEGRDRSVRHGFARRIHWARQECIRLDGKIMGARERLASLRESSTFPLWFNPTLAQTVIVQRAASLRIDIAREEDRLDESKLAFRHALAAYAVSVA